MKLILYVLKNDREIPFQDVDYDGDPCNAEQMVAAINKKLQTDYKPLWVNDVTEIGDTLLILSYRESADAQHKYDFEYCRGKVRYIADKTVGDYAPATMFDYELANWIALNGIDKKHDTKKGEIPPQ